jgi:hypothetical protein
LKKGGFLTFSGFSSAVPVLHFWALGPTETVSIGPLPSRHDPATLGEGDCKNVKRGPDRDTILHCTIMLTFLCNAISIAMPAGVVSGEARFFGLDSEIGPPVRRRDAPTRWAGACFEFDGLETALIDRRDVSGKIN